MQKQKIMKKIYIKVSGFLAALALLVSASGCESIDLGVEPSPNFLNPTQADVDFFLVAAQQGVAAFHSGIEGSGFKGMSQFGMEPVRMLHGFGPSYRELNEPAVFNRIWNDAYSEALIDIRTMNPLAEEGELWTHLGIGQVLEAYVMMTLVDYFGDVPYTEALQGVAFLNPAPDDQVAIYEAVDQLLLDAIANFGRQELALPTSDLFYGGDEDQWVTLANTLRLKLYLQTRLASESSFNASASTSVINSLIAGGNLITSSDDDWQYQYGTTLAAPDSRHPFFEKNYGGAGPSADFYAANYFMDLMANQYDTIDPRIRYYYYRQVPDFSDADVVTNSCSTQAPPAWYAPGELFCQVPADNGYNGLWGWDHLRDDGIPPDDQFRTLFGVYPVGGPFDDESFRNVSGSEAISEGLAGAGIAPFMMSSWTNFMLAEAALTLGTTGDARAYLETGIRESFAKVTGFGERLGASVMDRVITPDDPDTPEDEEETVRDLYIPTAGQIDGYVARILTAYDAGDNTAKLKIIVEQYFIALFGNGIEAYNTYRRTGMPNDMQPAVDLADPGVFVRSHWYPQDAAVNNSNLPQKQDVTTPVFWDTNPAGFVD